MPFTGWPPKWSGFSFRSIRPVALMADAISRELKTNRRDADLIGKGGAIQREAEIVREAQEMGERALRNQVEHRIVAQAGDLNGRFASPR